MNKTNQIKIVNILITTMMGISLSACNNPNQNNQSNQNNQNLSKDQQIAENAKEIELLKQQAEIQRLKNELNVSAASQAEQVYQLAASEVANTIPANLQEQAKQSGQPVQGTDGQQYMYDPSTGNWLLYGAIGAAAGYLLSNAMNNKHKYAPVAKPTAAVSRVYQDYQAKNPRQIAPPKAQPRPTITQPTQTQNTQNYSNSKPTPNYRPINPNSGNSGGYSNYQTPNSARRSGGFGFGGRRR